jgi:phosphoglycolate phosphatase
MYREHYAAHLVVESREYPGVLEVLRGALAGAPKAVVTNKPHVLTDRLLCEAGFANIFDPVIGTGWKYPAKPAKDAAVAAMLHHGARRERTILVGDSSIDRATAANAGITFGWVSYGYDTLERDGSFRVFENPGQWAELINGGITHGNV